jgi:hypothetical protein
MTKVLSAALYFSFASAQANAAGPTTFFCDYQTFADGTGVQRVKGKFELTFIVDANENKAYVVGNNGSNPVQVVPGSEGVTFIEVTDAGNVMITTIARQKSVHSRSTMMSGGLVPSQYYGTCLQR